MHIEFYKCIILYRYLIIYNSTMAEERTYIMVKPDGVQRGLVG